MTRSPAPLSRRALMARLPRCGALAAALLAPALLALSPSAQAQSPAFPSRPITLLVPYPAGGGADALARALQPAMSKALGQPVVVENVSGAGGSLGVQRLLAAPADGHTIMVGSPNEVILAPLSMQSAGYRPEQLRMLAPISSNPLVVFARKDLPANSIDELVALARKNEATPISFGSIGHGSMYHIVAEYFGQLAGLKLLHVPYKGTTPLVQDLAGQQIDFAVLPNLGLPTQMLESGRLKALTIMDSHRMPTLPKVGTTAESQVPHKEELLQAVWAAVLVRADVPEAAARVLLKAAQQGIASPETAKVLEPSGVQALPPAPLEQTATFYRQEIAKFQAMARSIKLSPR